MRVLDIYRRTVETTAAARGAKQRAQSMVTLRNPGNEVVWRGGLFSYSEESHRASFALLVKKVTAHFPIATQGIKMPASKDSPPEVTP